jgi:protein-S-isoprenylcysteine O-methyltransferase Ste14
MAFLDYLGPAAACATAICFIVAMRYYFDDRHTRTGWNVWLAVNSTACALAHLAFLIAGRDVPDGWQAVGIGLFAAALALFWWAVAAHGRTRPYTAFAHDPPGRLVTGGPYRYVRHPFYTAYLIGWVAGSAVTACLELLATAAWMFAIYYTAAVREERVIRASALSAAYESYCRTAGRFVPRPFVRGG